MKCPECGFENHEGAVFCDDCGVTLNEESTATAKAPLGALELGQVLNERWKISRVVHYDSRCGFYEAEDTNNSDKHTLVVEGHNSSDELDEWARTLGELDCAALWCPQEIAVLDERLFVLGPWPGEPLRHDEGKKDVRQAYELVRKVMLAVEKLREAGWKRCTLSPDYVWKSAEQVTLLTTPAPRLEMSSTDNTAIIEGFSAPEMFGLMGGTISERSDVFGLGALLYYLLNEGELNIKRLGVGCFGFPNPQLGPKNRLMEIATKALKREPLERFASVQEMRMALEEAMYLHENPEEKLSNAPSEPQESESKITQPLPSLEALPVVKAAQTKALAPAPIAKDDKPAAEGSHPTRELDDELLPADAPYEVGRITNVGAVRTINQDAFVEMRLWACERDVPTTVHFLAVIDGMGGEAEGDKAASIAVRAAVREVVHSFMELPGEENEEEKALPMADRQARVLERALRKANEAIFAYAGQDQSRKGMGCTASAALISRGRLTVAHVGDTRAYRFDGELKQITRDHSVVGQLVEMGALTKEQARNSPKRSLILRALGTSPAIEIDTYQHQLKKGDYLFISCDGVWEYYSDEELQEFFTGGEAPQSICEKLVATCLQRGADDNTTSIIFRYI